jgi:uncharacterized protein (DUF362 family)
MRGAAAGGLALAAARFSSPLRAAGLATPATTSRVALTAGDNRADNVFRALRSLAPQITRAIGDRPVVIKPNNVAMDVQLSATHADCVEGILEFLRSIGKAGDVTIAESAANGPTLEGFANFGYTRVAAKYGAKLADLDAQPVQKVHVFDETDFRPHAVRMSRLLLDPKTFIISAAVMKTHDRVVATLSLKNIVIGAPVKDLGFGWGRKVKPGTTSDKPICHGGGFRGLNYNLYALAQQLHPHLAVVDGYEGMEGNGPVGGQRVEHRICVASADWLAADRLAIELMGIDFAKVGYLNFCAQAGLGEADLTKIEVVGEPPARHVKSYKLATNIEKQLIWMTPPKASG